MLLKIDLCKSKIKVLLSRKSKKFSSFNPKLTSKRFMRRHPSERIDFYVEPLQKEGGKDFAYFRACLKSRNFS